MNKVKMILVAGARPNFMKIAPIMRAIYNYNQSISGKQQLSIIPVLVHTGQHYDKNMSHTFFESLGIKNPDYNLNVGSASHAEQTAKVMIEFEKICVNENPNYILVVGDVNSTIAAGLVAKKLHINLIHVEAGLRSGDRNMPEEINRLATDAITDLFFTTEPEGSSNLLNEGQDIDRIKFVGHVMIDNLFYQLSKINKDSNCISENIKQLKKNIPDKYICMTMHRPSNVDSRDNLEKVLNAVDEVSVTYNVPVIFPCHPRTLSKIKEFELFYYTKHLKNINYQLNQGIYLLSPLSYDDFLYLWKDCTVVLTDSGGIQEETTALKIPCITLRENTERPITCTIGSNTLVGLNPKKLKKTVEYIFNDKYKKSEIPELWDGKSAERIIEVIINHHKNELALK